MIYLHVDFLPILTQQLCDLKTCCHYRFACCCTSAAPNGGSVWKRCGIALLYPLTSYTYCTVTPWSIQWKEQHFILYTSYVSESLNHQSTSSLVPCEAVAKPFPSSFPFVYFQMSAICIWMLQSFREKLPRLHWDTVLHKSLVVSRVRHTSRQRRYLKKEMRTTLREEAANFSQDLEITGNHWN